MSLHAPFKTRGRFVIGALAAVTLAACQEEPMPPMDEPLDPGTVASGNAPADSGSVVSGNEAPLPAGRAGPAQDSAPAASNALAALSPEASALVPETYSREGEPFHAIATATLEPTDGHEAGGQVLFIAGANSDRIHVVAELENLAPGEHGFHVHENGDCSAADASSAGGHFNPADMPHGARDDDRRHVGDLGNLEAGAHGYAEADFQDARLSLEGEHAIVGKAVIVHAEGDDLDSQPSGAAGARVACGVIALQTPAAPHSG